LLIGVVLAPFKCPSAVMSKVPPLRLLNTTPADKLKFPPDQVVLPPLFKERPSVTPAEPIASTPPLLIVVVPVPLMVPLVQFTVPFTARLPAPVTTL
jgi:hypothetical protein